MSMNIVLVFLCLAVLVNGLSITRSEVDTTLPEDTATEPETPTKVEDLVISVQKRAAWDEEKDIKKQLNLLKKLCRPQLTPVYVKEELGPKSDLQDSSLLPEVLAVKRCNSCTYCGDGLHAPDETCRATKSRTKNFTIRAFINGTIVYKKVSIKVDRKCACKRDT